MQTILLFIRFNDSFKANHAERVVNRKNDIRFEILRQINNATNGLVCYKAQKKMLKSRHPIWLQRKQRGRGGKDTWKKNWKECILKKRNTSQRLLYSNSRVLIFPKLYGDLDLHDIRLKQNDLLHEWKTKYTVTWTIYQTHC